MADDVFIEGRSAFHAGSGGKALARPDVCLVPSPAGPVPAPLVNNALASDLDGGAKSVLFDGHPAGHADSYIGTSTGDEAADPKAGGQGNVVTHVVKGRAYFASYSMTVDVEGKPAIRHLDITTQNHAAGSSTPGTPPGPMIAHADFATTGRADCGDECQIVAYDKKCPAPNTPHHIIPKHCFKQYRNDAEGKPIPLPGWERYNPNKAPCVCVPGETKTTADDEGKLLVHGLIHKRFDVDEAVAGLRPGPGQKEANLWTYGEARDAAVAAVSEGTGGKCNEACLAAVLDGFHLDPAEGADAKLRAFCPKRQASKLRQQAVEKYVAPKKTSVFY